MLNPYVESLGGFIPPIAQTKGPAKRKKSSDCRDDPFIYGPVRAFSRIFP